MTAHSARPNPGSDEALALGCICPVLDNRHGAGLDYPDGPAFWVNGNCPIHGREAVLHEALCAVQNDGTGVKP